jgi:hypothetical protein
VPARGAHVRHPCIRKSQASFERLGVAGEAVGLVVGLMLLAVGFVLSLYPLATWNEAGFGRLNYPDKLCIVSLERP